MRQLIGPYHAGRLGAALLILRAVIGLAFIFHGLPKVQDVGGFAGKMHLPLPVAAFAAWSEVGGGALLILGLLTPVAALALLGVMVGALTTVHLPHGDPFVNPGGASYELAAVYLCAMIAFLLTGPGAYSLDALLLRDRDTPQPSEAGRRGLA